MDELLSHKLDDLKTSVDEIKTDVKSIKDEAPIHRIAALEAWRSAVNKFMAAVAIAVIGAWAAVLVR